MSACQPQVRQRELLQYLSPLGWEHINLTGDYVIRPPRALGVLTDARGSRFRHDPAFLLLAACRT